MEVPYLVQRMSFRDGKPQGTQVPSFDETLSMDYMGSSEFEWGALPKSLKRICTQADALRIHVLTPFLKDCDGAQCSLVCLPEQVKEYSPFIHQMAAGTLRLKESTQMDRAITGKDYFGRPVDRFSFSFVAAWWDIDNDVMWTFGNGRAQRIIQAIRETRDRKRQAREKGWY